MFKAGVQRGHEAFTLGQREESSSWTLIYFCDEIDKIRGNFEVMTFFWPSLEFWNNILSRGLRVFENLCKGPTELKILKV